MLHKNDDLKSDVMEELLRIELPEKMGLLYSHESPLDKPVHGMPRLNVLLENTMTFRLWKEGRICVITGPIFSAEDKSMKDTGIRIPQAFYKVILDTTPPEKMIGFIIPNETTKKRLGSFIVTVDDVEKRTGCDFFSGLPDEQEQVLESSVDPADWGL